MIVPLVEALASAALWNLQISVSDSNENEKLEANVIGCISLFDLL